MIINNTLDIPVINQIQIASHPPPPFIKISLRVLKHRGILLLIIKVTFTR